MSTTATPRSASPGDKPASRRRRISGRPGVSLLARGDSLVWLTGGALVIAIAMIVCLMGLILSAGLPAMWPSRVVAMKLVDGPTVQGEETRSQEFQLTSAALPGLTPESAKIAGQMLGDATDVTAERRLIRVGNFEITGVHYRWVNDFDVAADGVSYPEWVLTVERLNEGRFYGTPKSFVDRRVRQPSAEEKELASLVAFFESGPARADADDSELLTAAVTAKSKLIEELRTRLAGLRRASAQALLDDSAEGENVAREVILADGRTLPAKELTPADLPNVVELRQVTSGVETAWSLYNEHHSQTISQSAATEKVKKNEIGYLNVTMEEARLAVRDQELATDEFFLSTAEELHVLAIARDAIELERSENGQQVARARQYAGVGSPLVELAEKINVSLSKQIDAQLAEPAARQAVLEKELSALPESAQEAVTNFLAATRKGAAAVAVIQEQLVARDQENARYAIVLETSELATETAGDVVTQHAISAELPLADIVRAYPANQLSTWGKTKVYVSRWWEFLTAEPRQANSEGGVMPAIWGTVAMTLIMSLIVVPFGVLAALYLREYAKGGFIVSAIRVAINNLAGVPSIVFGVFGYGFFCLMVGSYVDGGPTQRGANFGVLSKNAWWIVMAVLAVTAIAAFAATIGGITTLASRNSRGKGVLRGISTILWLASTALFVLLLAKNPYFGGFYAANLPNPTFGKPGLMWASLTLALLTLPVVIVATEEALSAVPNSLREGSYASGASKWQTIRRIVLPHAMPGIMTGMILAMARGAGEVAPLMVVGAVKMAPSLPIDGTAPFVHPSRSFMHLGFHIFDLGFQSPNAEAAKPMVFTTTLLLIGIIASLNVAAIALRTRLRRRFHSSQF